MSHYRQYRRVTTPAPARHAHTIHPALIGCLVLGIGVFLLGGIQKSTVLADQPHSSPSVTRSHMPTVNPAAIEAIVSADTQDQIGVAVRNLNTRKTDTYGINAPFVAASTTKVLSAVTYYHFVETGRLQLDTKLGSFPAWFQIKQMIINSSNDSWHAISDAIGNANLQAYASSIGMDFTQGPNTMSPASMALLLAKLYKGELLNAVHTKTLLGYMRNTNNETLIPAAAGKDITTYHKYGDLDDELHDAAILVHGDAKYALVVYTKGSGSTASRTALIKKITHAVIAAYKL